VIEVVRVVESQATLSSYRATKNLVRARELELLIESTKPGHIDFRWHSLIATPFRYSPPLRQARFRPPYGKNVFYGSMLEETALYEHAFHFMKQRQHLEIKSDTGCRTIFSVKADDTDAIKIKHHPHRKKIMDKNDYSESHQFVQSHPNVTFIIYSSCRDPKQRDNAAILDIKHLDESPAWESSINFFYDNQQKKISWLDYNLDIQWSQVS